ncbi:hypothetical protein D9619_009132 [Psilocybe cf. subviscida]|uniref:Actin-related protein 2/3 complex subunit 5 n=1 Tax=Psilocybe cf. subviscida TaxID=2480587 RepID=A0A8H5FAR7_9AGAR|nr:hypothetical protein D9619_009132 [Psilocybe cf. subviscida]
MIRQMVSTDANIKTFIKSALSVMETYGFDGLDIDWEYPAAQDRGGVSTDTARYTEFMRQVKKAFEPNGYGLTFTAPSSYWYLQHFDLPGLMKSADWVNIMTYDLHGTWDGVDPFIGKIVLAHTNLTEIKQTMQLFYNVGVDPSQMVLGIGFYGSPIYDDVDAVKYVSWDDDQWVSYDDAQTLQQKLEFANTICLGGTMIWSLDQDDTSYTALSGLFAGLDIHKPSRVEHGNECQITGCGQDCPVGYTFMTHTYSNPAVAETCDTDKPAKVCCPPGAVPQDCHWRGFEGTTCNAQCDTGEIVLALDSTGDDGKATCAIGNKAYCCKSGERDAATLRIKLALSRRVNSLPIYAVLIRAPQERHHSAARRTCKWVGDPPDCLNAVCDIGQVAVYDALPVKPEWVFPSVSPVESDTYNVDEPATFTVDFDDNTDAGDTGDDGEENDSPFGEVFISSPHASSVSSLDLSSDWVLVGCSPTSDQPQQVTAYCSKSIDDTDSGCGHVFIGKAIHTIVRMPKTCGLGPYARVVSLEPHPDQTVVPPYHASQQKSLVYSLSFDYNFAAIPEENGPVLDAMINSAPDDGTTSTRRNAKRDFHQPEGLEKRWFGPFDAWLKKLNTITSTKALSQNFHWSDTYTIFHQEEQCPHFMSSLDISVSGHASFLASFGYYLEATVVPPEIQQAYLFAKSEASASATFTIEALAGIDFSSDRSELISFGFPGLYYPGLLTLGPSLHIYGQLIGELSMSGKLEATIGYTFPSVDWAFGKQDSNTDEEPGFDPIDFNTFTHGIGPGSFDVNVNLEGNFESIRDLNLAYSKIPSFQIGLRLSNADIHAFLEADMFAGFGVNGSVSLAHYGANINAGVTGELLFWRPNPLSVPLFSADVPFYAQCWNAAKQGDPTNNIVKRDVIRHTESRVSTHDRVLHEKHLKELHDPQAPAHITNRVLSGKIRRTLPTTVSPLRPIANEVHATADGSSAEGNEIVDTPTGTLNCNLFDPDLDPDQSGDRMARRDLISEKRQNPQNLEIVQPELQDIVSVPSNSNPSSNETTPRLPPFKVLDSQTSNMKSCKNFVSIPNYNRVPITGYFDLDFPAALTPQVFSYGTIPVLLQNAKGNPGLVVRPAATFIDYLKQQTDLYQPGNTWCAWVKANLQLAPSYFSQQSLFSRVGDCYPNNNVPGSKMPANSQCRYRFDGERNLDTSLGKSKDFRDPVREEFLRINTCVRQAWSDWSTAYLASTDPIAIAAPNRGNVNVPNLYDNYIHTVIANMPVYLRSQVTTMIALTKLDKDQSVDPPVNDLIDLSFDVLLDDKANGINIAGNQLDARGLHAFAQDQRVTQQDLTDSILNEIKGDFSAFRKIDIDIYDEDVLQESELYEADPRDPAEVLDDAKQRQAAVRSLLAKNDIPGALTTILENAPYGPNVDDAKVITLQTLLTILNTTKSTDITGVIKSLSLDTQDTLMKYLYKGMAMPGWGDISGSVLLGWHEKLTEVAGVGCIVRTMTDRRAV